MTLLITLLSSVALATGLRSSMPDIGLMESRTNQVICAISLWLAVMLLIDLLRAAYEDYSYRRWLNAPD